MAVLARFTGAVMLVTGALLVVDVALTLTWQEPLTALMAGRAQARVDAQLDGLGAAAARDQRATATVRDPRRRLAMLARRARTRARDGRAIGRIELPTLGRGYGLVQGTGTDDLKKGPAHYPSTPFPGEGGTTAVAGHRTTYMAPFRTIDDLRKGDRIVLSMPYGRLTYRVRRTRIVRPSELSVLRRVGYEQLVLSACHPLYSASRRIVVFAKLDSWTPRRLRSRA